MINKNNTPDETVYWYIVYHKIRENTDNVVTSTIPEHLNTEISEEDIDRSHRAQKFDPAKTKPRPVIVKFAMFITKCSLTKKKLKKKEISISESLTKLRLVFGIMMGKLCRKTATTKLIFL